MISLIKNWNEIWWAMADGDYAQYMTIKGMDVVEFFDMYDLHKKKIDEVIKNNPARGK